MGLDRWWIGGLRPLGLAGTGRSLIQFRFGLRFRLGFRVLGRVVFPQKGVLRLRRLGMWILALG